MERGATRLAAGARADRQSHPCVPPHLARARGGPQPRARRDHRSGGSTAIASAADAHGRRGSAEDIAEHHQHETDQGDAALERQRRVAAAAGRNAAAMPPEQRLLVQFGEQDAGIAVRRAPAGPAVEQRYFGQQVAFQAARGFGAAAQARGEGGSVVGGIFGRVGHSELFLARGQVGDHARKSVSGRLPARIGFARGALIAGAGARAGSGGMDEERDRCMRMLLRLAFLFIAAVNVPLAPGLIEPNAVYGFRTPASLASPAFYAAHRASATAGVVLGLAGFRATGVLLRGRPLDGRAVALVTATMPVAVSGSTLAGMLALWGGRPRTRRRPPALRREGVGGRRSDGL